MTVTVRPLIPTDADAIVGMHDTFMAYLGELGDPDSGLKHFTVERYLADGFGPDPVFAGYIAEDSGTACCGFSPVRAARASAASWSNAARRIAEHGAGNGWNGMYTGPTKWRSSSIARLAGWRATHWPS